MSVGGGNSINNDTRMSWTSGLPNGKREGCAVICYTSVAVLSVAQKRGGERLLSMGGGGGGGELKWLALLQPKRIGKGGGKRERGARVDPSVCEGVEIIHAWAVAGCRFHHLG